MRNRLALFGLLATLAACGPVEMEMGAGGGSTPTPTPTATPTATPSPTPTPAATPSLATFTSDVQPILEAQGCGVMGCHLAPGNAGVDLVTTAMAPANDIQSNFNELACNGPLDTFNPAAGAVVDFFCVYAGNGAANATAQATQHNNRTFSTANCVAFVGWIESGGAGALPTCP